MEQGKLPTRPTWKSTRPERILAEFLYDCGYEFVREQRFGRYRVDFYLPEYHLAFEADGEFWHGHNERFRPGYYQQRDGYLLEQFSLPVVRLTDREIQERLLVKVA